jgi:class 3 adenylate cyclase
MSLREELVDSVQETFKSSWDVREGRVVPDAEDLTLSNDAVRLEEAVVLYADLAGSTALVRAHTWQFAAEIYKAYLYCAARILRSESGTITAYDGDRIMAIFLGDAKNTSAARAALKLNYCRVKIINPLLQKHYQSQQYALKHVVGIDRSELHAARTGARGANDLVWVGRAANYAAKLSDLSSEFATRITKAVYDCLRDELKTSNGQPMWEAATWTSMANLPIYRSRWLWPID